MTQVPSRTDLTGSSGARGPGRSTTILVTIGSVFEGYDFTLYGLFAPAIAATFFPSQDSLSALLTVFLVFVVGFLARPIGGLVFGRLVDRKGRKPVMLVSMMLMAVGALLIAVAPGYTTAGAVGPLIVVVGRICQGLSLGAEQGSAGMFLVEWAPPGRRAFFSSPLGVGGTGGVVIAALLGALLTTTLGTAELNAWAWRLPFLLGAGLAVVVYFLRRDVEESPVFRDIRSAHGSTDDTPAATSRMSNRAVFVVVLGFIALWTTTVFTTLTYMPTFAVSIVGVNASGALWATVLGAALTVALTPVGAWVSDRIGRRPVILFCAVGYLILTIPLFALVVTTKELWAVLLLEGVLAIFSGPIAGVGLAVVVEMFHGRNHGLLVTVTLALGFTVFGGFGPYVCTWLIRVTGQQVAPSYWVVAMSILTLTSAFFIPRDLHRRDLARRRAPAA